MGIFIGFTKMHGLGNDFVVIDNMEGRITLSKEQIVFLCDRRKSVGADGVILIEKRDGVHAFMNYINADGSEAQMCGNGIRCTAKFLKENLFKNVQNFKIATRSGDKTIICHDDDTYSVNMGRASFVSQDFVGENLKLEELDLNFVSMGNPFAIAFVSKLEDYDFENLGPKIENNKIFPNKMNFELVERKDSKNFTVRVWERGCGETLACGTGACAVYAVSRKQKIADPEININFKGGTLIISENEKGEIVMRGPAISAYAGVVEVL